jgi:hypothetical protein
MADVSMLSDVGRSFLSSATLAKVSMLSDVGKSFYVLRRCQKFLSSKAVVELSVHTDGGRRF